MTNSAQPSGTGPEHPLDPLTAGEIRQVAQIVRRDRELGDSWRFASIELAEPAKDVLAAGQVTSREAIAVGWDRADGQAYRARVSLTADAVTSWQHLPGQQPNMTADEWHECDQLLRAHPEMIEALARRGITDMSLVLTDMWAYGAASPSGTRACGSAGATSGTGTASTATRTPTTSPDCIRSST